MPEPTTETQETETKVPDPRDAHIEKLNKESETRRKANKELEAKLADVSGRLTNFMQAIGVDKEEDLEARIGEYRATAEERKDPNRDPKVLLREKMKLEDDHKKLLTTAKADAEERDLWRKRYEDKTVGSAIREAITTRGVKEAFRGALEGELRKNVQLNENHEPVWVVRGKDGQVQYESDVNEGISKFFTDSPDWLPPVAAPGSGTTQKNKPTSGTLRKDVKEMTLEDYKAERPGILGIPPVKTVVRQ